MPEQHFGKSVLPQTTAGNFIGLISDCFYPDDNESLEESIILETEGNSVEFSASQIFSIKII